MMESHSHIKINKNDLFYGMLDVESPKVISTLCALFFLRDSVGEGGRGY